MGQYNHHVVVCTSGKTCPTQGSERVDAEFKRAVKVAVRHHTSPGDNMDV